jgi:hypothetical protein
MTLVYAHAGVARDGKGLVGEVDRWTGVRVCSSSLAVKDGGVLALKKMILARTIDPIRVKAKTAGKADFASKSHIVETPRPTASQDMYDPPLERRPARLAVAHLPSRGVTRQPLRRRDDGDRPPEHDMAQKYDTKDGAPWFT